MSQSIPLPPEWIDRIFTKLSLTYGRAFMSQYEGLDPAAVKADWAMELSGFQRAPEALRYGLQNLPADRVPNVLQFRALCRRAPAPPVKQLPAPQMDEAARAKVRAMLNELRVKMTNGKAA